MTKAALNPFLPSYEYIPDGEPHIFGDRIYLYGSHDRFNGLSFCLNDYVCWSAPISNLADWRYEGVIFRREQDPEHDWNKLFHAIAAPDMCRGSDGRYYLYYFMGGNGKISVAVCDTPAGKYQYLGAIHYSDGMAIGHKDEPIMFDPGIFIDDDGKIFLYTGFALKSNPLFLLGRKATDKGPMCFELAQDMRTVIRGPVYIGVESLPQNGYEEHPFLEASSMRKFNGKYYFIYSSMHSHELCYAVSDWPDRDFKFGGVLISNGDIGINGYSCPGNAANYTGNTHGSLIEINGVHYVFYHRHTNRKQFSRQACAERIRYKDGRFLQTEMTSSGLNHGPLPGLGIYEARIACCLFSAKGPRWYSAFKGWKGKHPFFTQSGKDREDYPDQYIANFTPGAWAGFKYFDLRSPNMIRVRVRGSASGYITVSTSCERTEPCSMIMIRPVKEYTWFEARFSTAKMTGPLWFTFLGKGRFDFFSFELLNKQSLK